MVLQRSDQHCHGLDDNYIANAGIERPEVGEEAEVAAHGCICFRWSVSSSLSASALRNLRGPAEATQLHPHGQEVAILANVVPTFSVCIISIVRLHSLLIITTSKDQSYDNAPVAVFSIVEINVALICACLPTLRPLLVKWFPRLSSGSRGTHGASGGLSNSHGLKRTSVLGYGMNSLSTRKGVQKLEGESDEDDKIRVVTNIDVKVSRHEAGDGNGDGRESSTESLFRDRRGDGYVV